MAKAVKFPDAADKPSPAHGTGGKNPTRRSSKAATTAKGHNTRVSIDNTYSAGGNGFRGVLAFTVVLTAVAAIILASSSSDSPFSVSNILERLSVTKKRELLNFRIITREVYFNGESNDGANVTIEESQFVSPEQLAQSLSSFVEVKSALHMGDEPVLAERIYTDKGRLVKSFDDVIAATRLYLVPQNLHFVWPFVKLGHIVRLGSDSINVPEGVEVEIESLSESPRVFHLRHFFSEEEADTIISRIDTGEVSLKRSTVRKTMKKAKAEEERKRVDDMNEEITHRSSEGAFDKESDISTRLMKRMFELLRMPSYVPEMADGLQLLRYRQKQAYNSHRDYLEALHGENLDPANNGTNRFATVFLYLSDVAKGGQTAFPLGEKPDHPLMAPNEVPEEALSLFSETAWEHRFIQDCYNRLAVPPKKSQAVLFYSQTPDGRLDPQSLHGGCPIIEGTKLAANAWVWNKPMYYYFGKLREDQGSGKKPDNYRHVTFVNKAGKQIELYWEDKVLLSLEPGQTQPFNTYIGHRFRAAYVPNNKVAEEEGSETSKTAFIWEETVVEATEAEATFIISPADIEA